VRALDLKCTSKKISLIKTYCRLPRPWALRPSVPFCTAPNHCQRGGRGHASHCDLANDFNRASSLRCGAPVHWMLRAFALLTSSHFRAKPKVASHWQNVACNTKWELRSLRSLHKKWLFISTIFK
jgi:hypothetical protein